jgi:hypothetical protein
MFVILFFSAVLAGLLLPARIAVAFAALFTGLLCNSRQFIRPKPDQKVP